uniref:Uncharacterized protein n=1 Tax=Rhizophora mucronata TaxID=61149 RepID=A0A2P2IY61_RHIMU
MYQSMREFLQPTCVNQPYRLFKTISEPKEQQQ